MTTQHHTLAGRLAALLIATALLACGLLAARADAAPAGAIAGATAPIATVAAPPAVDDFSVTTLSRATARLVGHGAYSGMIVDVQGSGSTTIASWKDWIGPVVKAIGDLIGGGSGSGSGGGRGSCGKVTVTVEGASGPVTVTVQCPA